MGIENINGLDGCFIILPMFLIIFSIVIYYAIFTKD